MIFEHRARNQHGEIVRACRRRDDTPSGRLMRRSLHFVPGGYEKMIETALTLPADGLILDLEDAQTPHKKTATRPIVRRWLETLDFGKRERWVRMNARSTPGEARVPSRGGAR